MTDTETTAPADHEALRELLVATDRDPIQLAAELRAAREAATCDAALVRDLQLYELRFLQQHAGRVGEDPSLVSAVAATTRAWLEHRSRTLVATEAKDASALFDLVELRATMLAHGMVAEAAEIAEQIAGRAAKIELDDVAVEEARERYAALATDEEEQDLQHRILIAEETQAVMARLAERSAQPVFRRMSRRLSAAVSDRRLAARIERILTPRGAALLEAFSLGLLVLLFLFLIVESLFEVPANWKQVLLYGDAFICLFFIAEFLFKFALAPARWSWFLRHMITDLLPALPAAAFFLNIPAIPGTDEAIWVRALRFLRITYFARYIQALRPILRSFRLVLFCVRGLDSLMNRFSHLTNRNFVFFEKPAAVRLPMSDETNRQVQFRVLRREHVLISDSPAAERIPVLCERAGLLESTLAVAKPLAERVDRVKFSAARDVRVEDAIEQLHAVKPEELSMLMPRADVFALDRVVRVLNAPIIRILPFIRRVRSPILAATPEERVADLSRRVANLLESWQERALFFADLSGILTGPQILDRVATTMINASKRPAVRLLLFGGLFLIVRLLIGENSQFGEVLRRFVATPLIVLGAVCFFVLLVGRWLKQLAGEATETLKRTSEAHFIGLLELIKQRNEPATLDYLARRIFRWEMAGEEAGWALGQQVTRIREGRVSASQEPPEALREDINRTALLYLHFLDGAILHDSDVKTTEQLLANLSLENIRNVHLDFTKKDRKRLKKLTLADGSMFRGPYLWFRFITESVALETAKLVIDYNRHCVPKKQIAHAPAAVVDRMNAWLERHRTENSGRTLGEAEAPEFGARFTSTEFSALDFLMVNEERDDHIRRVFGQEVLEVLRKNRREMTREIFGTRPLHKLPRSQRTVNFYQFYRRRLSGGRVLLAPIYWLFWLLRGVGYTATKTAAIAKEILVPAIATRERGAAPFSVALRKIHRMKAPGLLEAMLLRVEFDPAYCGSSPSWSDGTPHELYPEVERDLDFLHMKERDRDEIRSIVARNRRVVEELHTFMHDVPELAPVEDPIERRMAERAVTIAYMNDRSGLRTMLRADQWLERELPRLEARETEYPMFAFRAFRQWIGRGFRRHPVTHWLSRHWPERRISWRGRRNLRRVYREGETVRTIVDGCLAHVESGSPCEAGLALATRIYRNHGEVSRELTALRAVQTLSVLDVHNYRKLVFDLGDYAADGEDPALAEALP